MSLQAQEPSCLSMARGRAELPPVALELGEAVEIARSQGQSRTLQEPGRQRSRGIPFARVASAGCWGSFLDRCCFCHNRCPRALSFDYSAIGLCIIREAGL